MGYTLGSLIQIARGLAAQFGADCEILIHDLLSADPEHTIVHVENGHVTDRKVGGGPSKIALSAMEALKNIPAVSRAEDTFQDSPSQKDTLQDGPSPKGTLQDDPSADAPPLNDSLGYLTRSPDGRILKSSTLYIRDETGTVHYMFCINFDITRLIGFEQSIHSLIQDQRSDPAQQPEPIVTNVNDLLDTLIQQSVALVGKPAALMNKEEKIRAIQFLNNAGAFLVTKSGDKVSQYFGISKFTLYSYIDIKNRKHDDKGDRPDSKKPVS